MEKHTINSYMWMAPSKEILPAPLRYWREMQWTSQNSFTFRSQTCKYIVGPDMTNWSTNYGQHPLIWTKIWFLQNTPTLPHQVLNHKSLKITKIVMLLLLSLCSRAPILFLHSTTHFHFLCLISIFMWPILVCCQITSKMKTMIRHAW